MLACAWGFGYFGRQGISLIPESRLCVRKERVVRAARRGGHGAHLGPGTRRAKLGLAFRHYAGMEVRMYQRSTTTSEVAAT